MKRNVSLLFGFVASTVLFAWPLAPVGGAAEAAASGPLVRQAVRFGTTPPLTEIARPQAARKSAVTNVREVPRVDRSPARRLKTELAPVEDPVVQRSMPRATMPAPLATFEGVDNLDGVIPPDSNGDVGPQHYLEMVNMHFCVYDKATGTNLIAPMRMSELFAAAGFDPPASTTDDGDPIVLYDPLADRWMISQFIVSVTPCHEVIAVSQTPDPTGAWYLYDFVMPNNAMNDYPHFGVWPDAYYMSDNQFDEFSGAGVFAFDRVKMLAGDPSASYQYFNLDPVDQNYFGLLPCDLDGPPPPAGTPNYFGMTDAEILNPFSALYIWEFHVDWDNPTNSTFGNGGRPNYTNQVADFNPVFPDDRNTIPQPGTTRKLDPIGDRLMHRLQYRNFGSHESLVGCHTVNVGNHNQAGVRYFQLSRPFGETNFVVAEQATFAPDGDSRWMGSAAMDGQGNLAVGYSVSSTGTYPSIRYAGRLATDSSNGLFHGEATMFAGSASQTAGNRWGDYTALSVDPLDDTTFWYVNQYSTGGWAWRTRIGSFRLGTPISGTLAGRVTNDVTGLPVAGASLVLSVGALATSDTNGHYTIQVITGLWTVVGSAPNFYSSGALPFSITLDETTSLDVALSPIPLLVAPGAGLQSSGGQAGPFTPNEQNYTLSNAILSDVSWTAVNHAAWVDVSPTAGSLNAGATTTVNVRINHWADFLPVEHYTNNIVFQWNHPAQTTSTTRRVALTVSPGSPPVITNWDFNAGLPDEWTVEGEGWTFDDPGGRGNLTGGTGLFAIADSDYAGEVPMDTELRTPSLDLAGQDHVTLCFRNDFRVYSATEVAAVDASLNGEDGPWSNLWQRSNSLRGPLQVLVDADDLCSGQSNVMFRFHYTAFYDYWWEVDDVAILADPIETGALAVTPILGLEASGYYLGPFAPTRYYCISNAAGVVMTWTTACDEVWFDAIPPNGALVPGAVDYVTVQVNAGATSFPLGNYHGGVAFSNSLDATVLNRNVALTVVEPLSMSPTNLFSASGLEGGPFTPAGTTNMLANPSSHPVSWTSSWNSTWLQVDPLGGDLAAGATQSVSVTLITNLLTTPGGYEDRLTVSNLLTGATLSRVVTVMVFEVTGRIGVYDSIPPTNDLALPFGMVTSGIPRTEHITIANTGANDRNLVVSNIFFYAYLSPFESGSAAGWAPTDAEAWQVTGGVYRANGLSNGFVVSTYAPQDWRDIQVDVMLQRSGHPELAQGVAIGATPDFDAQGAGSAHVFLVGGEYYSIWRVEGAVRTAVQGWSYGNKSILAASNRLTVICSNGAARFIVNGVAVWDGPLMAPTAGRLALIGFTRPSDTNGACVHYFRRVEIGLPGDWGIGVGRKQLFYNGLARPDSHMESPDILEWPSPIPPGNWAVFEASTAPASPGATSGPFTITNLPALPATLAPGESFAFDVIYGPLTAVTSQTRVAIWNNDNVTPLPLVSVSGYALGSRLAGRVTDAFTCRPIQGAIVRITNGLAGWSSTSAGDGSYAVDLPAGPLTYRISAACDWYATGTAERTVSAPGLVITQDFELVGSRLYYGPSAADRFVLPGRTVTNRIYLTNAGPLTISFATSISGGGSPAWISLGPAVGDIPAGSTSAIDVILNAAAVTSAPPSIQSASVTWMGSYLNTVPALPVTMRIQDDGLVVVPAQPLTFQGAAGGPFSPASGTLSVGNIGAASLTWLASADRNWLSLSPTSGVVTAGGSQAVSVNLTAEALALPIGNYVAQLIFSNLTSGSIAEREVHLTVCRERVAVYAFDLETDPGWTAQGEWAFGVPQGGGSYNHDPVAGFTGTNVYGYNLNGDYSNDLPRRCLTTTPLNFSQYTNIQLTFHRWLGVEDANYDRAGIECSRDGTNWSVVWSHAGKSVSDSAWLAVTCSLPAEASLRSNVWVRWVMGETDDDITYPGWNIDDVSFSGYLTRTLMVESAHGQALPAAGTNMCLDGQPITCLLTNTLVSGGGTQFLAIGWTGTGSVPATGSASSVTFALTNDSAIRWQWATNYYFSMLSGPHGSVFGTADGWYSAGTQVMATAVEDTYYHFDYWSDVPAGQTNDNPLALTLAGPRNITAWFGENRAALGTPEWWLAQYGWTTDFDAAETNDTDNDRVPAGQEYVADTIPTNGESYLHLTVIGIGAVEWVGGTSVVQYLDWTDGLWEDWMAIATNQPPTPIQNNYPANPSGAEGYYRIRAVRN